MRIVRVLQVASAAFVLAVGLGGCAAEPLEAGVGSAVQSPRPSPPRQSVPPVPLAANGQATTFVAVVDGDTIETGAGTVRIIGIDTPERSECGYDEASMAIGRLVTVGDPLTLELPPGQNDTDHYGRLIRFVTTDAGVDLGLMQLQAGNALARYDSTDGYPAHPREASYHAAQIATHGPNRTVVTAGCHESALAEPPAHPPSADDRWWVQYSSCTQLKKNAVGHPTGPFSRSDPSQAEIYEWFAFGTGNRGDGDGDGLACEGW